MTLSPSGSTCSRRTPCCSRPRSPPTSPRSTASRPSARSTACARTAPSSPTARSPGRSTSPARSASRTCSSVSCRSSGARCRAAPRTASSPPGGAADVPPAPRPRRDRGHAGAGRLRQLRPHRDRRRDDGLRRHVPRDRHARVRLHHRRGRAATDRRARPDRAGHRAGPRPHPLATSEWYGEQPDAVWPWAQDELGDATPTVLPTTDGLAFERIAALRPDLILATNAGLARADYDKLRRIAPTVAQPRGGTRFLSPWDVQTELIAAALGRARQGRELVASIERDYAAVAREHPEFAGKTITFTQNGFYQGQLYAYPEGLNTQPLSLLGFTVNPRLTPLAAERGVQVGVSAERLDVLDADVLVAATERAADVRKLLEVPTFRGLRAVRDRHAVYTDRILAGALYYPTPLSLPYLLERLVPRLERAVAGTAPQRIG
ncbi:ABC transporter substrate-binding protein [Conexibacter sp. W3-3-2]|nr:ABC transporter substrate-binding protein [Conexibacter sp. W3-3-2]